MRIRLAALLSATFCVIAASPAIAATRNFTVPGFEEVRVEGPFRVKLATGVPPSAKATGPQAALDRVAMDVLGRTLVIHSDVSAWGGDSDSGEGGPVEIAIGTHDLNSVAMTGSGLLQIDAVTALKFNASVQGSGEIAIAKADVDQLSVDLTGTASATIAGKAGMLTLTTRGSSAFDGSALTTKDATLTAEGAATVKAHVSDSAEIRASGPATITLTGNPGCTTHAGGSASVAGCRVSQ